MTSCNYNAGELAGSGLSTSACVPHPAGWVPSNALFEVRVRKLTVKVDVDSKKPWLFRGIFCCHRGISQEEPLLLLVEHPACMTPKDTLSQHTSQ